MKWEISIAGSLKKLGVAAINSEEELKKFYSFLDY